MLVVMYRAFIKKLLHNHIINILTSSDFGVSTGLISQGYWESSKWYKKKLFSYYIVTIKKII